jgi:hypothetical protein
MHSHKTAVLFTSVCVALAVISIGSMDARGTAHHAAPQQAAAATGVRFEDVTRAAGIHFVHNNGAFGKKWLPEAMGPGVAFLDYDNDGWQDILLANGMDWP